MLTLRASVALVLLTLASGCFESHARSGADGDITFDGGTRDSGTDRDADASETDSGETDSGETDSGETDSGETDSGETDTSGVDSAIPDSGPMCELDPDLESLTRCTREGYECSGRCLIRETVDGAVPHKPLVRCLREECGPEAIECLTCAVVTTISCISAIPGCGRLLRDVECCLEAECGGSFRRIYDDEDWDTCASGACIPEGGRIPDRCRTCPDDDLYDRYCRVRD